MPGQMKTGRADLSGRKTMEEKESLRKQRIPKEKRRECLRLFEAGYGYKKTAQLAGLNTYTVREYKRRYIHGDSTWAERGSCPGLSNEG